MIGSSPDPKLAAALSEWLGCRGDHRRPSHSSLHFNTREPNGRSPRRNHVSIVKLTPSGGRDAAALCEHAAAALTAQVPAAAELAEGLYDGWLGECEEGRGWARMLHDKSVGAHS